MTLSEYKSLDMDGKMLAIKTHGKPMYIVTKGDEKFILHSMGTFFTEIAYDKETNDMLRLAVLINGPELDKYSELENEIKDVGFD